MGTDTIVTLLLAAVFMVCFTAIFFALRNTTRITVMHTKTIAPDDFLRLIEKEDDPIVYYFVIPVLGFHHYYATIKRDRICTRSRMPLDFSTKCDLIPLKKTY